MQSLAPSEYFPGIKFNYSFYTTGDTKVTLEYVNNNFLKCTGYAYSRAISTSFNGIIYALGGIETTDITASGTISANLFQGSGTELTHLNASNISDGTLAVNRGGTGSSTLALGQLLIGNDTDPITQSANLIWDITNNNLGIGKNPAQKLDVNGTISATLFSGSGASLTGFTEVQIPVLTAAKIPELPQSKITGLDTSLNGKQNVLTAETNLLGNGAGITGFTEGQIPELPQSKITGLDTSLNGKQNVLTAETNLLGNGAGITSLDATKLTGTIDNARLPTDISVNSFTGDGSGLTSLTANNLTGTIDNDRIALTTTKLHANFNQTTFIIKDDKIDLAAPVGVYSYNILAYDKVFGATEAYLLSGRFTCSYEDRTGIYLLTPNNPPVNKLILNYKVGDKIIFKNSASVLYDYLNDTNAFGQVNQRWGKLTVFKIAVGTNWTTQGEESYMTKIFEWNSSNVNITDYTQSQAVYPWQTPMTLTIETGFKYFIIKWLYNVDANYYVTPATEANNMNIAYNGGQGFKMISGYTGTTNYTPSAPILQQTMTDKSAGVAKRGLRLSVDETTGTLNADIPTATEIYGKLNTSHFVNNVATGKIDISTNLAELKGPKGDDGTDGKGWTGATYSATTGKVSFASSDGTPFVFDTGDLRGGKGDKGDKGDDGDNGTNGKGWTGATYSATTGKVSFTSTDGTPFVFDTGDLRGGTGATGKGWTDASYNSTTGIVTFASNDALGFTTGNLKGTNGTNGTNGKGWTGATYNATTGKVSFTSTDGTPFVFDTGDLRGGTGANGKGWTGATYNATTGKVSFTSTDGFAFDTGDLRGASGSTITATQLSELMNTTDHFTLNGTKIDFKTTYKIPTAGTADAVAYSGITSIPTSWTDSQIPALAISKITGLQGALDGKAPTSHTHTTTQITGLDTALTGKQATLTSTNTIGVFNTTQFENVSSLIQIKSSVLGGGLWQTGTPSTKIYYNGGYVGIGTTNPTNKLHIIDDTTNTTALTIQNNFTSGAITATPTSTGTTGAYTYMVFTYTTETGGAGSGQTLYTINVPTGGVVCDVLVVGGGGGGGGWNAGGGGAGGLVLIQNISLSGNFTIKVGDGGSGGPGTLSSSPGLVGKNTTITKSDNSIIITANGGGRGGASYDIGGNGGSGGGGGYNVVNGTQTQKSQTQLGVSSPGILNQFGENGGHGGGGDSSYPGGGGGGAGGVGATSTQNEVGVNGGLGIDRVGTFIFKDNFNSSIGDNGWFAGGGGSAGGYQNTNYGYGNGGSTLFGGGGNGDNVGRGINGINGTGGGGGGVRYNPSLSGGKGGSGIIIIRYISPTSSSTIELLRGTTVDANTDYRVGNYDGDFKVKKSINNTEIDVLSINQASTQMFVPGGISTNSTITSSGSISAGGYLQGSGGGGAFRIGKPDGWVRLRDTGESTHLDLAVGQLYSYSTITSTTLNNSGVATIATLNSTTLNNTGVVTIGGINDGGNIIKLAVYASDSSGVAAIFKHPNDTQGIGIRYGGLVALGTYANQGIILTTRGTGGFVVNNNAGTTNFEVQSSVTGPYGLINGDWYVGGTDSGYEIYSSFKAVSLSNTDHLVVQRNFLENEVKSNWIMVGYGSFTAFHRCYTDDGLYNNENDEDIDIFKNKYIGRVVIATGKIKTDYTRKIPNECVVEEPAQSSEEPISKPPKKEIDEWYSAIDKDGITIEDAIPVVQLSRIRKDKRVFGVLGDPNRSTNNKNRLIVNSIGEGGICVSNTNGNIENGDYIQSSDLLGYGEKQDDDLLHNYTIAKSTIDCNFELDSPYYQCHEIENGVRVAFIACSYHCG